MTEYLGPQAIIEKKQQYIMPCLSHFYAQPPEIVRGSMQYLFDHTGKKYLDCFAGVSVINCGHCNPEITEKLCEQIKTLQHVCNIYLTEPFVRLAERLAAVSPGNLQKSFFASWPYQACHESYGNRHVAYGSESGWRYPFRAASVLLSVSAG